MADTLGVIGCGNMGSILVKGIVRSKVFPANNIFVYDIDRRKINQIKRLKVKVVSSNIELVKYSKNILIAVKPQTIKNVLSEIKFYLNFRKLIISIAAGIPISFISKVVGKKLKIVRVMPNIPALVGEAMTVYSSGKYVLRKDKKLVNRIFSSVGVVIELSERYLNRVTALSGSGPGYIFYLIESMLEQATAFGFPEPLAKLLIYQTLKGSLKLLDVTGLTPLELRQQVTSPGGTTEACIKFLETKGLKKIIKTAIEKAEKKAVQLSKNI